MGVGESVLILVVVGLFCVPFVVARAHAVIDNPPFAERNRAIRWWYPLVGLGFVPIFLVSFYYLRHELLATALLTGGLLAALWFLVWAMALIGQRLLTHLRGGR